MKRDESAVPVMRRELGSGVEGQTIRRPVRGEERFPRAFRRAITQLLAVASELGRLHQLRLAVVEVAIRPTVVAALIDLEQLLRGQVLTLVRGVKLGPVVGQLIAAVLGRIKLAAAIEGDANGVADSRRVPAGR